MKRILILALFISATSHAAGIKKWTDESGQVHYGDRPPAKVKIEDIRVSRPPSNPGKPLPRLNQDQAQPGNGNNSAQTGNQPGQEPQYSDDQKTQICERAKKDLNTLNTNDNIRLRSSDGKVRFMSDSEKKARKDQATQDIQEFCN